MMKDRIVIAGAAILDVLVSPAGREVFDTGSYPAEEVSLSFGGDALNEASVLAALGKKVHLETVIGEDTAGAMIENYCGQLGISLGKNHRKKELQTGINVVLVQENGERSFLTGRRGSLRQLGLSDITRPFPEDGGIFCLASMFVSPLLGVSEMAELFRQAKSQGMLVCADMTKRKNGERVEDIREALSYVDYLMPNEEEAALLTGKASARESAEALLEAGAGCVIVKCGKRGCYLCTKEMGRYVPAAADVLCVDTTGAGDSFAAGFVYGLSQGWALDECAAFANRCGARAVEQVGATAWCQKEFIKGDTRWETR